MQMLVGFGMFDLRNLEIMCIVIYFLTRGRLTDMTNYVENQV